MTNSMIFNFVKDTDKLMGIGSVESVKSVPNVYFQFTMQTESKAKRLEQIWNKSFSKLNVIREGKTVIAG